MTPIEELAKQHGVPELELLEFFLERAAIREYDAGMTREAAETAALEDARVWAQLWKATRK
jgi:hypothetical protein